MSEPTIHPKGSPILAPVHRLGTRAIDIVTHTGSVLLLVIEALRWFFRNFANRKRMGTGAISMQIIRIGVRSIFIVSLVSFSVGLILALNMAPPLDQFGSPLIGPPRLSSMTT